MTLETTNVLQGQAIRASNVVSPSASPGKELKLNVFLGPDCKVHGKLELSGMAQVEGRVEGEIHCDGMLVIGKSAVIDAAIGGSSVQVYGTVNGNISCSKRLELCAGANVTGDLRSAALVIQDGAFFSGRCSMSGVESQQEASEKYAPPSSTISLSEPIEE